MSTVSPPPQPDTPDELEETSPTTIDREGPAVVDTPPPLSALPADTAATPGQTDHLATPPPASILPPDTNALRPSLGSTPSPPSIGSHAAAAVAAMEASVTASPLRNGTQTVGGDSSGEMAHPVVVFINSKSGGRLGPTLLAGFQQLIGESQVFDLSLNNPRTVLSALLQRLDAQCGADNAAAIATREAMRILVCGGDGTVGWVLASLETLQLRRPPPVGVIPLGTGNDLARTFGWGASFSSPQPSRLRACLERVAAATPSLMDNWQVELFPAGSAAPLTLPHALHPHQLRPTLHPLPHQAGQGAVAGYKGGFWNYFSLGMDAHTAYAFHHLRERKPWMARGRTVNQGLYAYYGCAQGWFCLPCACYTPHEVSAVARIQYAGKDGVWHPLLLPSDVRAVVVLNLQSYAGGRNPWGRPSLRKQQKHGFSVAAVDDGLLEVVALTGGWHTAAVMGHAATARRLVQASSLLVELHGERAPRAYMQMDGEPWVQPCDPALPPAVLQITHSGQSVVLAAKGSKVPSRTLGQTVTQPEPNPPNPPEQVVESAEERQQGPSERTGSIELARRNEEEEAVEQAERKH